MLEQFLNFLKEIFYFPIWWYTRGLFLFAVKLKNFLSNRQQSLALFVWIKNIFTPMYGQRDVVGILVSLWMRVVLIIWKSFLMLIYLALALAALVIYLGFPIFVIYQVIYQIT